MGRKELLSWTPPPLGVLKLNFDGASKGNPRQAGYGSVIRGHNQNAVRVICGPLGGV